nr:MAG TPA: GIY-YIG nuclease superfamily protein [Bacteriophage sp.]
MVHRLNVNCRLKIKMENNLKWIVYCTTCTINNKIYIGVHKTVNPEVFDGYLGCRYKYLT